MGLCLVRCGEVGPQINLKDWSKVNPSVPFTSIFLGIQHFVSLPCTAQPRAQVCWKGIGSKGGLIGRKMLMDLLEDNGIVRLALSMVGGQYLFPPSPFQEHIYV